MGALPKDVRIVCQAKKAIVVPPYRDVQRGGSIQFIAVTGNTTLFFPKPNLFTPPVQTLSLSRNNPQVLNISPDAPVGGHPYAAYCEDLNEFAEGGSPPMMIIE